MCLIMKIVNTATTNDMMKCLTKYWRKHGFEVEVSCLYTFEADQLNNIEPYDFCCELKRKKNYGINKNK